MDRDRGRSDRARLGAVPGRGAGRRVGVGVAERTRPAGHDPGAPPPAWRRALTSTERQLRRSAPWTVPLLLGLAGALLAIGLLARETARIGPATVRFSARPAAVGTSELSVPPFGSVSARTHQGPLALRATLENVDVDELTATLGRAQTSDQTSLAELEARLAPLEEEARAAVIRLLVEVGLLGLAGGAAAVLAFRRRTWRRLGRTVLGGLLGVAVLLAPSLATYNADAFRSPRYQGALEYAPALVGDVRTGLDRLQTLRQEMALIADNLNRAYAALADAPTGLAPGTVRILHVSDLHLNPAGFDLAQRLARQFEVAAVVDTGDMGTWGLPPEREITERVAGFGVPYLFVAGNHDNDAMAAAVADNDNARVLDHESVEIAGIHFYGVGDPTFSPGQGHRVEELEELKEVRSADVANELDRASPRPDVLLVHDGRFAKYAMGHVATVLDGHYHRFGTDVINGTRELTTGSTGAAGPDGFRQEDPVPYEAEVIYFDPGTRRPVAVDQISVQSLEGSFAVDRTVLDEGRTFFAPNPVPVPEEITGAGGTTPTTQPRTSVLPPPSSTTPSSTTPPTSARP